MNRRGMIQSALAALASIPCVGWVMPVAAAESPTHTLAYIRRLEATRDLLIPALYGQPWNVGRAFRLEARIDIDYEYGSLLVCGKCEHDGRIRELGFALTKERILDGLYKDQFRPCVASLLRLLTNTSAAEYDRTFGPEGYAS